MCLSKDGTSSIYYLLFISMYILRIKCCFKSLALKQFTNPKVLLILDFWFL